MNNIVEAFEKSVAEARADTAEQDKKRAEQVITESDANWREILRGLTVRAETAEADLKTSNQHAEELNTALADARKALEEISRLAHSPDHFTAMGLIRLDCEVALTPKSSTLKEKTT